MILIPTYKHHTIHETVRFKYLTHALTKSWKTNFMINLRLLSDRSYHTEESIAEGIYIRRTKCSY